MSRILLISDDPARSSGLVADLSGDTPCEILDLYADEVPAGPASAIVTDVRDLGGPPIARLRELLARTRRRARLVVLLHADNPRTRMLGVALGATHTLFEPFHADQLRAAVGVAADPLPAAAVRTAADVRAFYGAVFVPDRPITPDVIDNGTEAIDHAIRDTGIRDWIRAVRQFDDATHQHCLLVTGLAAAFAASLGLGEAERHRLTKAALLHDVGKVHVPVAILNKPGRLDEAETAVMRLHPEKGEAMLAGQGFGPEVLSVVRSHHEMLDGSGYPDRLKAQDIPDIARLVTVCDIYGARIEHRSYKSPMPGDEAYGIVKDMPGRLDPALVHAFRPVAGSFTPSVMSKTSDRAPPRRSSSSNRVA